MSSTYANNLDILRAFAVLLVLSAHSLAVTHLAGNQLGTIEARLGRIGVLFFFVHTSLVLMGSIERLRGDNWISRFYLNRAFRVYPLSILCIGTVLLFRIPPVLHTNFVTPSIGNLVANFLLIQNLGGFWSVSGAMWSLPFEIQMYLLLPFIYVFIQEDGISRCWLLVALSVLLRWTSVGEFFPCFMGGILAYAMRNRRQSIPAALWPFSLIAVAAGCYICGVSPLIQIMSCLTLGVLIPRFTDFQDGNLSKLAHLIARYSYGIYLSHMPLRWLCFEYLSLTSTVRWIAYISLVATVSISLYYLVEYPAIQIGKRMASRKLETATATYGV